MVRTQPLELWAKVEETPGSWPAWPKCRLIMEQTQCHRAFVPSALNSWPLTSRRTRKWAHLSIAKTTTTNRWQQVSGKAHKSKGVCRFQWKTLFDFCDNVTGAATFLGLFVLFVVIIIFFLFLGQVYNRKSWFVLPQWKTIDIHRYKCTYIYAA